MLAEEAALYVRWRGRRWRSMSTTAVRERPILFSGEMVRAILDGRKTQTRRLVKLPKWSTGNWADFDCDVFAAETICRHTGCVSNIPCPYGHPGDRLWVRETWRVEKSMDGTPPAIFDQSYPVDYASADDDQMHAAFAGKWRPSIHMPRWASRINLEITDVRVQRLQEISEGDACAEGAEALPNPCGYATSSHFPCCKLGDELGHPVLDKFRVLWESINGKGSWASNPWVWAISFRRLP